jgi:hypothetical protein
MFINYPSLAYNISFVIKNKGKSDVSLHSKFLQLEGWAQGGGRSGRCAINAS